MSYLNTLKLPDEVTHFVFKVYGTKNYHMFCKPNSSKWENGIVMLYSIDRIHIHDKDDFEMEFNTRPVINKDTAKWLVNRGYDVFGFIEKGWVANFSIYEAEGYEVARKFMDKALLKYQRELNQEEEKLGRKEDSKVSLLERRSWTTLKEIELEPIGTTQYETNYGWCVYKVNEIGKLESRSEYSKDGEVLYEAKFHYRKYKNNYYLYKYENTEGIVANYDGIQNERWKNKGYFR